MRKILARIKGGLGNQLFCYAAARRLALVNSAELVIDAVTGFARDHQYKRKYALDHFHIPVRKATPVERLEPFERYRRGVKKWIARRKSFSERSYLEQESLEFDERLLTFKVSGCVYLDGFWQSEGYFKDVEQTIRADLRIVPPGDILNQRMAEEIRDSQAVALHVRWFDAPGSSAAHNVAADYYQRAIALAESKLQSPRYFLFSDNPEAARTKLTLPEGRVIFVCHNLDEENAYADLWLMSQCRHFITANSTFSWWGAWLGETHNSMVITPGELRGQITAWGFSGLIPERWITFPAQSGRI